MGTGAVEIINAAQLRLAPLSSQDTLIATVFLLISFLLLKEITCLMTEMNC